MHSNSITSLSQIILITDGSCGMNILSLSKSLLSPGGPHRDPNSKNSADMSLLSSLPFNFPAKFHIICIASPDEPCLAVSVPVYQKIIDISGAEGSVFIPDGNLSMKVLSFSDESRTLLSILSSF